MKIVVKPPDVPFDPLEPRPLPERSSGAGTRLWLVRHAEVHEDWQQRAYGGADVPLSAQGEQETRALGARFAGLPVDRVVSSSLARALAMGRSIAAATGAPLEVDARLVEVSRGAWQGLPVTEFRALWEADRARFLADPWTWKGHGGESDADVFARAWPCVQAALRASAGGTVVVTSHYNLIRALATRLLGLRAAESFAFRTDTAHAALLVDEATGWRLVAGNVSDPRGVDAEPAA